MQKQEQKKNIFAWLLVLLPVLSQYTVGPLDLDVVVVAGFFLFYIFTHKHLYLTKMNRSILWLLLYIIVVTVINLLIGTKYSPSSAIVVRTGKFCLYLFMAFFVCNEELTYESMMRTYRIVAYAATIYVIIQTIAFYGAGITLPNKIGGSAYDNKVEVGRLRAFYSEPAAMAYSIVPFVVCSLFGKKYRDGKLNQNFDAFFVSVGIILSTSGQGILAIGVAWAIWVLLRFKNGGFRNLKELLLLISVVVAIVVLYNSGILKFALERATNTSESGTVSARTSGYATLELLGPMQRIFGAGYGNYVVENNYGLGVFYDVVNYSSIAQFLFTQGIVGTAGWAVFFFSLFRKGNACVRVLVLVLVFMSVGGCPMLAILCPTWLILMGLQLPKGQFSRRSLEETA
ncbi:MAG: hypothetical protein IKU57_01525 [Oscillospiraceae bacterium]|nr:hypothetical protein [Oscillospiraceae bacterium]